MKLFLVAGEPSGDRLGGALMEGLRTLRPEIAFEGVGGERMTGQGLRSLFPMNELSVMGIAEVLPRYFHLRRRMIETVEAVIAAKPAALVTIDSPDFGLRVAARVRAAAPDVRTVHYVAPSVWAWRPKRAKKMARYVDHVLALLPFEPPYMEAAGMACDFVGHPVVTEQQATDGDAAAFRDKYGLGDSPVVLVLPGSRVGEVDRLVPIFGAALRDLHARLPRMRAVVPAASPVVGRVLEATRSWSGAPVVIDPRADTGGDEKRAAFRAADVALAASGTVSLELAAAATPTVVAYDMSWISWQIMSRAALIDTVTLVNLVSETRVVPEFLGPACEPGPIAAALHRLLTDEPARVAQKAAMELTMDRIGRGGDPPGLRAARAVLHPLQGK